MPEPQGPPRPVGGPTFHLTHETPGGRHYWDPEIYARELDRFFYRSWLQVGREDRLAAAGDFVTVRVGRESVLIVRDGQGRLGGFYNLCRHRGTQVVQAAEGKGARSFVCPYHSWTYGLDGRLTGAPYTGGVAGFDRAAMGLWPVRVDTWGGFVWVNLEPNGPSLRESIGPFLAKFEAIPFATFRSGGHRSYEVEANWKILVENFSECYHCAPIHPSLNRLTPATSGANDAFFHPPGGVSNFSGGYMEFARDFTSMTRTGYTRRPRLPGLSPQDARRVQYYTVFPNLFFSVHPDYLMTHRVWPVSVSHCRIENEFYFAPEAADADGFDPSDAIDLWDEINRQDWAVCELAQQGVGSRAWKGGRYSERETLTADFDQYVLEELHREP